MTKIELKETLGWEVERLPLYVEQNGVYVQDGTQSLRRSDTNKKIHPTAVTDSFQFTNIASMAEKATMLSAISGFPITGWSEFAGGSKVLCYLKSDLTKIGPYEMKSNVVLGTGYDGTTSFFIGTTSEILRCQNQWGKILRTAVIKNSRNHESNRDDMVHIFAQYMLDSKKVYTKMEDWIGVNMSQSVAKDLVKDLVMKGNIFEKLSTRSENKVDLITQHVISEMNLVGDNAFGFFNGITHYTTHELKQKHESYGNLFGNKQNITEGAIRLIEEYA